MHGRGEEPAAGEDQEARAGSWGGMAQLVGEQILGAGEKEGPAGGKAQEPGLATLIGQQVLGAKEAPAGGEKAAGTDWAGMASGAAASFVGGGGGQGGSVSGATHEGTGTANAGLVDKLLGMYNASTGQQVWAWVAVCGSCGVWGDRRARDAPLAGRRL